MGHEKNTNLMKQIETMIYQLILKSSTSVPFDVLVALKKSKDAEKNNLVASSQLTLMIENILYGSDHKIPICQDTGHLNFFIQLGEEFPIHSNFHDLIQQNMLKLTEEAIIRPNSVDPLTNDNPGNNSGFNFPPIYLDLIPHSSDLIITVLNKGGGSENMCQLFMLNPAKGRDLIIPTIVQTVKDAGGKPCPPIIIGVGLGGDATKSMYLAKKALLRPIGSRNNRADAAYLEEEILNTVNLSDVGVMGLGGISTCLDVHVEMSMRHPATYPLGIVIDCYSHRTQSACLSKDGSLTFGRLDEKFRFEAKKEDLHID